MLVKLTAVLLFTCMMSTAQMTRIRSLNRFDKFTEQKKIEWAAYVTDTIHPAAYATTGTLLNRFQNGEIRIYAPFTREGLMAGDAIQQLNKTELEQRSFAPGMTTATNRVNNNPELIIEAEEIFYIERGNLRSYVPWVTAKKSVYTSGGIFIGTSNYISAGINYKHDLSTSRRRNLIFIGSKKRRFSIDSIPKADMLKETFGMNFVETIWNDISRSGNEVIDVRNGQNIVVKNLYDVVFPSPISIPLYDSSGVITRYENVNEPASPLLFKKVEIDENWYYDAIKNCFLNNITAITLFWRSQWPGTDKDWKPTIKIIFK